MDRIKILTDVLGQKDECIEQTDKMFEALEILTAWLNRMPNGDLRKSLFLDGLGVVHQMIFRQLGQLFHIYKAIDCGSQAAALGHPDEPACLSNLGLAYEQLFYHSGKLEDIHIAINCLVQATAFTHNDHPDRSSFLNNLGKCYETLFHCLGELEHILLAVDCTSQALALTPDGHPQKADVLNNLGNAHETLFERMGNLEHIHIAIDYKSQVLALTPEGHPKKARRLNNLGSSYKTLFNRLGQLEHIKMAVECMTQSVALTLDNHPDKPTCLSSLGRAYETWFDHEGRLEHIFLAVECKLHAVMLTPDGHLEKPGRISNLGTAYYSLFSRLGEQQHILAAIKYLTQAVELTPDGHATKLGCLNNLGIAYLDMFKQLGDPQHIRTAVHCLSQAARLAPNDHSGRPRLLNNLGSAYEYLGELEHITTAIECRVQALALTPEGHPGKPGYLNNLGGSYQTLFKRQGVFDHLCIAIECISQAVTLTQEHDPTRSQRLYNLSSLYFHRFATSYDHADLAASKLHAQSAAMCPSGYPAHRLLAARHWAELSVLDGLDALEAYNHCMLRLPEAVWLGTSVHRRFECLAASEIQDLVSSAAVAAICAARYELAVEWLEQGRCLVWTQMVQLRTPLDSLHASYPELAKELAYLSHRLEGREDIGQYPIFQPVLSSTDTYAHNQLAHSRDKLIERIRLLPGFEDFIRPPKSSRIISHVHNGAAVILNVHRLRCDAIIINSDKHDITHVSLPELSYLRVEELRIQLAVLLKTSGVRRGFKKSSGPLLESFNSVLSELWFHVVKPVLDHLNISQAAPLDELPHITWCVSGPLSFLPIHAAGIYTNPNTILSNLAISSYVPKITSMGRFDLTSQAFSGILAVGHESSVRGLCSLPGTKAELDRVEQKFMNRQFTRLEEENATTEEVTNAMLNHSWVHFACHGSQDPIDPMNSALNLHDGDLSLATISKCSIKNPQLAFLSACQTAKGDSKLPDEVLHLAGGLLMAGYSDVIATMWSINDMDAPLVAEKVYECLLEDGVAQSRRAAKALHRAVKHLQDTIGVSNFARWVPYIHLGGSF